MVPEEGVGPGMQKGGRRSEHRALPSPHVHDTGHSHLHPVFWREKNVRIRFEQSALTDDGPWAVVVAEGLDSFWTLRKGEGCLGGMGPDTAAIGKG